MLKVIKAAQGLGFTLDEVADLLDAGQHRHGRHPTPACGSAPTPSSPRSRRKSPTCTSSPAPCGPR
ncbi:MerR family DNA-binding protein [Micromonospora sp. M12]